MNGGPVAHKLAALLRAFNRMRVVAPPPRDKAAPGTAPGDAADGSSS